MTLAERLEELFPVNERTHTDIPDGEIRWLLERSFLPGPFLWTWTNEGRPLYNLDHGHGEYEDEPGQGPGWWATRWDDPHAPKEPVRGRFFRTPQAALADVLPAEDKES